MQPDLSPLWRPAVRSGLFVYLLSVYTPLLPFSPAPSNLPNSIYVSAQISQMCLCLAGDHLLNDICSDCCNFKGRDQGTSHLPFLWLPLHCLFKGSCFCYLWDKLESNLTSKPQSAMPTWIYFARIMDSNAISHFHLSPSWLPLHSALEFKHKKLLTKICRHRDSYITEANTLQYMKTTFSAGIYMRNFSWNQCLSGIHSPGNAELVGCVYCS